MGSQDWLKLLWEQSGFNKLSARVAWIGQSYSGSGWAWINFRWEQAGFVKLAAGVDGIG